MAAGDPRWQGTREQEKRRQLAKKCYVAFRREEDDEEKIGKGATSNVQGRTNEYRLASNRQGNGWSHLRKVGPDDQRYATRGMQMLLGRIDQGRG